MSGPHPVPGARHAPEAPDRDAVSAVRAARDRVLGRIEAACSRAGRDAPEVTLVAVSKTVPAERLVTAVAAGIDVLGENRVQEAAAKIPLVPGVRWHLVGHLQRNKAALAVRLFDMIESLDSLELARRLDHVAGEVLGGADDGSVGTRVDRVSAPGAVQVSRLGVLLQVNVDADPAKEGFAPDRLERELDAVAALPHLELRGLMTVGRLVARATDARPTFAALRDLSDRLRALDPRLGPDLSMGMSDDFEIAIEEGATIVRVGRAIFGERPHE
jgi:hypothetical protein